MNSLAIRLKDVSTYYGLKPILKNVSLEVPVGTRVAIIGPNGVGKSTLLALIAGLSAPVLGIVEVLGRERRSSIENEIAIRKQCTYMPDDAWFPDLRTTREVLLEYGKVYEVPFLRLASHAPELLALFNMEEIADRPFNTLSAGQRKKAVLCAALVTDTPLLLLDEPFSGGLDPAGILALQRVLESMAQQRDRTIVFTTPVPELIEETADRMIVLRNGGIYADYQVSELKARVLPGRRFADLLQEIVFPETHQRVQHYLAATLQNKD